MFLFSFYSLSFLHLWAVWRQVGLRTSSTHMHTHSWWASVRNKSCLWYLLLCVSADRHQVRMQLVGYLRYSIALQLPDIFRQAMPSALVSMADIRLEVVGIREVSVLWYEAASFPLHLPFSLHPLTVLPPPQELTKMETRIRYLEDELRHLMVAI